MQTLWTAACQGETVRRIRSLAVDSPRQWGKMTVNQMVCHLADSYRMATGERPAEDRSTLTTRTTTKWIFLYSPLPPPKGVPTSRRNDAQRDGTPPTEFTSDRERLAQTLNAFVEVAGSGRCGRHPLFGALTPAQWMRWGYLHADHHLRQFAV